MTDKPPFVVISSGTGQKHYNADAQVKEILTWIDENREKIGNGKLALPADWCAKHFGLGGDLGTVAGRLQHHFKDVVNGGRSVMVTQRKESGKHLVIFTEVKKEAK